MTEHDPLTPEDFDPHPVHTEAKADTTGLAQSLTANPLIRLGLILLPIVVIAILFFGVFNSSKTVETPSVVSTPATVSSLPGSTASKTYANAIDDQNKQRVEEAKQSQASAIPTPAPREAATTVEPVDPLAEFTAPPVPTTSTPSAQPAYTPTPVIDQNRQMQLAQNMQQALQSILKPSNDNHVKVLTVAQGTAIQTAEQSQTQSLNQTQAAKTQTTQQQPVIVSAGTVLYGQTLTEADSDIPAPILVSILSGPFQGGRAIGTFEKTEDYLILAFGTVIKDKKEYKINAIAIDPETTLSGLETSTDHHYFERFVLPAAAAFVQGVGQAVQNEGTTTTVSPFGSTVVTQPSLNTHQQVLAGLGAGAQAIGSALTQDQNRQPTIHVASGTPIGIMFVNSVRETEE